MSIINAIILGLVQGITEFLPISSSGHLVIVSHILGADNAFTFDVLLNFGSLLALVVYYRVRIWSIIVRVFSGKEWLLVAKVIVATVPAVLLGLILNSQIEQLNSMIWVVIAMLVVIGIPMVVMGKVNDNADNREIEQSVGWRLAVKTGITQSFSLIPGVSRSGITILTGLRNNLSAERAAEFSFLLAIPIIAGASLKTLISSAGINFVKDNLVAFAFGNIVCFISGILAINFMIKLIEKRGLKDFGWYRVILAVVLAILLLLGII
ncbi:MAG: undecaprenyl-diphosphatase UppP [Candidatus Saccharibacteria bacterium]